MKINMREKGKWKGKDTEKRGMREGGRRWKSDICGKKIYGYEIIRRERRSERERTEVGEKKGE